MTVILERRDWKRGSSNDLIFSPLVYLFVLVIFLLGMGYYVRQQSLGAATWEDIYAKEFSLVLNSAEPGDVITLDIQKATEIAQKNHLSFEGLFSFPDQNVCVKLSQGRKSCQSYLNAIRVDSVKTRLGVPGNVIELTIVGKQEKLQ